jgi:RNA polymerase sigma factor (sigma-70 family)
MASARRDQTTTRDRLADAAEPFDLERVVRAASAGDRRAVADLVERFAARVRTVARLHRLNAHDVEDVMQTTWLKLLEHVDAIRDPTAIGAWLETTARRESLRVIRGSSRERPTDNELVLDAPVPPVDEQRLRAAERCAAFAVALEQVTGHQRELLSMLFADPAPSYAEISRALGMPIGSIGPTRARSLARLRENLDPGELADIAGNREDLGELADTVRNSSAGRCITSPLVTSLRA